MIRYIYILLLLSTCNLAFSQEIIISGVNKNRPLIWDDFKGRPDNGSSHDANTFWNLNYSISGISFKGDTAKIGGFSVKLELNEKFSWIKPEKQTSALLKHEQGHFDLGLICQRELLKQLNNTIFFKAGFQQQIQSVFTSVLDKYHALGIKYDEETDHSKNREAQEKWNNFFSGELNR